MHVLYVCDCVKKKRKKKAKNVNTTLRECEGVAFFLLISHFSFFFSFSSLPILLPLSSLTTTSSHHRKCWSFTRLPPVTPSSPSSTTASSRSPIPSGRTSRPQSRPTRRKESIIFTLIYSPNKQTKANTNSHTLHTTNDTLRSTRKQANSATAAHSSLTSPYEN